MAALTLPLFPLNAVLFPDGTLALRIFELRYLSMVRQCIEAESPFGVVRLLSGSELRIPGAEETLSEVGTMARIVDWSAPMAGLLELSCRGSARFRILSSVRLPNGLWMADVEELEGDQNVSVPAELKNAAECLGRLIESSQRMPNNRIQLSQPIRLDDCGWVANRWSELLPLPGAQRQSLLALDNPVIRLELIQDMLAEHGLLS